MRVVYIVSLLCLLFVTHVAGELPDLQGRWAFVQVYPQIAVLPIAGEVARSSTVVQLVEISQDGPTLTMTDAYCFTEVDDGTLLVETVVSDSFMASLLPQTRSATLVEQMETVRFESEAYTEVRGAVLDDPDFDPLPEGPDDPRVVDQDRDGNPGMTVHVAILGLIEGETYVVQRVRYRLIGVVVSLDRIEGTIVWSDEQVVLSATNPLLEADTIGLPDPDPEASRFVMVRADESWTCEALRERLPAIFEATGAS